MHRKKIDTELENLQTITNFTVLVCFLYAITIIVRAIKRTFQRIQKRRRTRKIQRKLQKIWYPDGTYWDDDKGMWIGSDFPANPPKRTQPKTKITDDNVHRWRWDPEKCTWTEPDE